MRSKARCAERAGRRPETLGIEARRGETGRLHGLAQCAARKPGPERSAGERPTTGEHAPGSARLAPATGCTTLWLLDSKTLGVVLEQIELCRGDRSKKKASPQGGAFLYGCCATRGALREAQPAAALHQVIQIRSAQRSAVPLHIGLCWYTLIPAPTSPSQECST